MSRGLGCREVEDLEDDDNIIFPIAFGVATATPTATPAAAPTTTPTATAPAFGAAAPLPTTS